ncbi:MAG: hypothetical protein HY884_06805 [Deltaproteobacteria bacterium]|nr:hypothetical protein [Deltaproteobacteria bacterium]
MPSSDCAIIEEAQRLTLGALPLEGKLKKLCALMGRFTGFDHCLLYLWDADKRAFVLRASSGGNYPLRRNPAPLSYGEGTGAASMVKRRKKPLELVRKGQDELFRAGRGKGFADVGLEGFSSAVIHPLTAANVFYGVIYLKSAAIIRLSEQRRRVLNIVALQMTETVKCAEFASDIHAEHEELVEARARLLNSQKLLSLGDMAATLAHEIRNPLLSIGGYAARLKIHLDGDCKAIAYVNSMLGGVQRVERLMDGMVGFLKDSVVELRPEDMNDIVAEAVRVFEEEAGERGIELVKDLQEGRLPVMADRDQLKIAFDNIIVNAIQSMDKGGRLSVSTSKSGADVVVRVADSGGGIEPGILDRIFNPFFTTKKRGTGLGLPITSAIVARHLGSIVVDNAAGVGATFIMKFKFVDAKNAEGKG